MPYDPDNLKDMKRLSARVDNSFKALEWSRETRLDAIKQYVGGHYGEKSDRLVTPVPFLRMAVQIYMRYMVARNPKVMVNSPVVELKPAAKRLEMAMNDFLGIHGLDYGVVLKRWVKDAMLGMGVQRIFLAPHATVSFGDEEELITRIAVETIDHDDWFHDMRARHIEEASFMGHNMRMRRDLLEDSKVFSSKAIARLTAPRDDELGRISDRVEDLSGTEEALDDARGEYVEWRHIYLPEEKLIVELPKNGTPEPLRVIEWNGPSWGPYHILAFDGVPNNVRPVPPIDAIRDMDNFANSLFIKIVEDSKNAKNILAYRGGSEEDAQRVVDSNNLDTVRVDDPASMKEISFNGADGVAVATFLQTRDLISHLGGNLDAIGGLGPQADTLGQDRMLKATASGMVEDMQDEVLTQTRKAVQSIAYHLWDDMLYDPQLERTLRGIGSIPISFGPEDRNFELDKLRINIHPYSMRGQSPEQKLQAINFILTNVVPMGIQAAQTGMLDFQRLLKIYADLLDIDELEEIFDMVDTSRLPGRDTEPMRQSPVTRREHVRQNIPGASRQGNSQIMSQLMMGGNPQMSERAALSRSTG